MIRQGIGSYHMTDKPTGPAAAAKEIDKLQEEWFTTRLAGEDMPHPDERMPAIEAIIFKHCPEDGVVRRLVYLSKIILEDLRYIFNTPGDKPDELPVAVLARNIARFESIIAVAEKTSSQPDVIPEDKAVAKLVEALRAIEIKTTKALDVVVKMCDHIRRSYSHTEKPNQVFDLIYGLRNVIRAALADYEKVKDTSCG